MQNFISKRKLSKWIAFWKRSADDTGSAIPTRHTAVLVSGIYDLVAVWKLTYVSGLVHAVSYSLLLLNTDLHVADLATRMSRSQFVRNTMSAIQSQLRPNQDGKGSVSDLNYDDGGSMRGNGSDGQDTIAMGRSKRSGSIASWNSGSRDAATSVPSASLTPGSATGSVTPVSSYTPVDPGSLNGSSTSLFDAKPQNSSATSIVYNRSWESDMENVLKVFSLRHSKLRSDPTVFQDMYNAIKSQQILQPLGSTFGARASTSSLSPGGNMLRNRNGRSPQQPDRLMTLKRGSIRGLQSILGGPNGPSPYSSNSSVDGRASPSPSFATSMHEVYSHNIFRLAKYKLTMLSVRVHMLRHSSHPRWDLLPICPTRL